MEEITFLFKFGVWSGNLPGLAAPAWWPAVSCNQEGICTISSGVQVLTFPKLGVPCSCPNHLMVWVLQCALHWQPFKHLGDFPEASTSPNAMAGAVMCIPWHAHVTYLLHKMHWLLVCFWVWFKVQFKATTHAFGGGERDPFHLVCYVCHIFS